MAGAHDQPEKPSGGMGELLENPHLIRSDLILIERALRENYPIEQSHRVTLVAQAIKIATDEVKGKFRYDARERLRALAVVDRFDRTNLERVRILAGLAGNGEGGYQPAELHKHEHLHVESPAEAPAPAQIEVVLVDDWYGSPDVLPAKKNGKRAKSNGSAKSKGNGKPKKK